MVYKDIDIGIQKQDHGEKIKLDYAWFHKTYRSFIKEIALKNQHSTAPKLIAKYKIVRKIFLRSRNQKSQCEDELLLNHSFKSTTDWPMLAAIMVPRESFRRKKSGYSHQ